MTKAQANTLEELAKALDVDGDGLLRTVAAYNAACQPGDYNPPSSTASHRRPHAAEVQLGAADQRAALPRLVVTCGITFTFGGLHITTEGVLDTTDATIPGLYAAGEAGGRHLYQNYLGGAA